MHGSEALERLDRAVNQIQASPSAGGAWLGAVQEFASSAAELELIIGRQELKPAEPNMGSKATLEEGIRSLEAELASKEKLLKHTEDQVHKWSALCQRLKKQHEKSMYDGIR